MDSTNPPPEASAVRAFTGLAEAIAGPVRQSVQDMARAFAGWPTDHLTRDQLATDRRSPRHVTARRRAANKRARATRQAQRSR